MNDIKFMRKMRTKLINVGLDFVDLERETGLNRSTFSRAYKGAISPNTGKPYVMKIDTRSRIELAVDALVKGK